MPSKLEDRLELLLINENITGYERQYKFHPTRKFRADFGFPEKKILIECQGGIWFAKSGHNSGAGITKDYEKFNEAAILGWRLILLTPAMINKKQDNPAISYIKRILQ